MELWTSKRTKPTQQTQDQVNPNMEHYKKLLKDMVYLKKEF